MRTLFNISLPLELAKEIRREVKEGESTSTSEYFRQLIRVRNIERLASELQREKSAFRKGRYSSTKTYGNDMKSATGSAF